MRRYIVNRIAIGLLAAASAGIVTWWVGQRAAARPQLVALAADEPQPSSTPGPPINSGDRSVITPQRNVDRGMVKLMPDVDAKMVVTPPWPPRPVQEPSGPSQQ